MFKVLMYDFYCRDFFSKNPPYVTTTEHFTCSCQPGVEHKNFVLTCKDHKFIAYPNANTKNMFKKKENGKR